VNAVSTECHDASDCAVDGFVPLWVASCSVDGRLVETAEFDNEAAAQAWCKAQEQLRSGR